MIEFHNIGLRYGKSLALQHINCQIPEHAYVVVGGPSGAGKSSLLRLLASFEKPSEGKILVNGQSITKLSQRAKAHYRRSIGYIGDDVILLPNRTCSENVALPLQIAGHPAQDIQSRVQAALHRVGLPKVANLLPNVLSGGEQQRVAIARAIAHRPALLIADEPTAQLDLHAAETIAQLFKEFNQAKVTIVVATHDPERFLGHHQRIQMRHGCLEQTSNKGAHL